MSEPTYSFISTRYRTRKTASRPAYSDNQEFLSDMTEGGEAIFAQGLPERSELVRLGRSFGAQIPTGSAFTFVNAWPTTRAELLIFNRDASRSYLIDRVWLANITSQAAAQPYSLLGQIIASQLANTIAAVADNANVLRHNLLGKSTGFDSSATFALANTSFAIANQWFPLGPSVMSPMTTNLGAAMEAMLYGRIIIPPGGAFAIAGLAGTAAGTAIAGIEWHEVNLTLP